METTVLSAEEAAEYGEFKRSRREAEISLLLRKIVVDASRRETDRYALKSACDCARKLGAYGVLVSPVNVAAARKHLTGCGTGVICLVGGTGESLVAVKKAEAKRAVKQGAKEIHLILCYSALTGGNASYLKREVKKLRRATKKCALCVSLEDHSLGEDDIALGVRAACEGKANGVCVRGETPLVLRALSVGAGRVLADCSGVENAAQLRSVLRAGASRVGTRCAEAIALELYQSLDQAGNIRTEPQEPLPEN